MKIDCITAAHTVWGDICLGMWKSYLCLGKLKTLHPQQTRLSEAGEDIKRDDRDQGII